MDKIYRFYKRNEIDFDKLNDYEMYQCSNGTDRAMVTKKTIIKEEEMITHILLPVTRWELLIYLMKTIESKMIAAGMLLILIIFAAIGFF